MVAGSQRDFSSGGVGLMLDSSRDAGSFHRQSQQLAGYI